ncbi:MAG: hypothetical protein KKD77_21455 [Gammaproteobacteria bacterium]|nr:hypothetical protein [Gammaproteobacteria bacterium]
MTYVITTTIGKIRLRIGDTDMTDPVFTDAEITYFYTETGDLDLAAAMGCEAWAAKYAVNAKQEKIGDYSYSQKIVDDLLALAEKLRSKAAGIPVQTWSEPDYTGGSGITAEED